MALVVISEMSADVREVTSLKPLNAMQDNGGGGGEAMVGCPFATAKV